MSSTHSVDGLVKQLLAALPASMRTLPQELEQQFQQILRSAFVKMDLVTREEFDVQVAVLKRTREKLDALQQQIAKHQLSAKE